MNKPVFNKPECWDKAIYVVSRKKNKLMYRWANSFSAFEYEEERNDGESPAFFKEFDAAVKLTVKQFNDEMFDRTTNWNQYKADVQDYKSHSEHGITVFDMISGVRYEWDYYMHSSQVPDMPNIVDWEYPNQIQWHYFDLDKPATIQIMLIGSNGFPTGEWITVDIKTPVYRTEHKPETPFFYHHHQDIYWCGDKHGSDSAWIAVRPLYDDVITRVQWDVKIGDEVAMLGYLRMIDSFKDHLLKIKKSGGKELQYDVG